MMEKSRSMTLMGGKGYVVRPEQLPEAVRIDLNIIDAEYKEQSPFIYCEYYTLDILVKSLLLLFGIVAALIFLSVGGLIWEKEWMLWAVAGLSALMAISLLAGAWEIFRDIINSRSGGPARRDYR